MRLINNKNINGASILLFITISLFVPNRSCLSNEGAKTTEELNTLYQQYEEHSFPKAFQQCINQNLKNKTPSEIERLCAEKSFEGKRKQLETIFKEMVNLYEKWIQLSENEEIRKNWIQRLNQLHKAQESYITFLKQYGESYAYPYLRNYPYHFYGSMIDLINIRIIHLKILLRDLDTTASKD